MSRRRSVHIGGKIKKIQARSDQTILQAMEQAHIKALSHGRSSECGWCHSKLLSGKVSSRRMQTTGGNMAAVR